MDFDRGTKQECPRKTCHLQESITKGSSKLKPNNDQLDSADKEFTISEKDHAINTQDRYRQDEKDIELLDQGLSRCLRLTKKRFTTNPFSDS